MNLEFSLVSKQCTCIFFIYYLLVLNVCKDLNFKHQHILLENVGFSYQLHSSEHYTFLFLNRYIGYCAGPSIFGHRAFVDIFI